jgi:DNA-binding NtrC family response regulator
VALHDGKTVEVNMLPDSVGAKVHRDVYPNTTAAPQVPAQIPSSANSQPLALPAVFKSAAENSASESLQWFSQPDKHKPGGSGFGDLVTGEKPLVPAVVAAQDAQAAAHDNGPVWDPKLVRPLEEVERKAVDYALRAYGGNVSKAARALKVNASTLYRKVQVWSAQDGASLTPSTQSPQPP